MEDPNTPKGSGEKLLTLKESKSKWPISNEFEGEQESNGSEENDNGPSEGYAPEDEIPNEVVLDTAFSLQIGYETEAYLDSFAIKNAYEEENGEWDGVEEGLDMNEEEGEQEELEENPAPEQSSESTKKSVYYKEEIPAMNSRYVMTHQEVRDLIDPANLKQFNDDIGRIGHLLETAQKDYCDFCCMGTHGGEIRLHLSQDLLGKLVYGDELNLSGNFLQQTVG
jgi:hypothetical protein